MPLAVMRTGLALALLCLAVELRWSDDKPDGPARNSERDTIGGRFTTPSRS